MSPIVRRLVTGVIAVMLAAAVVSQWGTVVGAVAELRTLSFAVLLTVGLLAIADRLLRAEIIRSLLPSVSLARAEVISDVGAAATKGIPLGGPVGTVLRWQIAREREVDAVRFVSMLVASGVAAAFVSWGLALLAAVADVPGRSVTAIDVVLIVSGTSMLLGATLFWAVVIRSDLAQRWLVARSAWLCGRFSSIVPELGTSDPEAFIADLWLSLRAVAARPWPLLARTVAAQLVGLTVLWVALVSLGASGHPAFTEFARVFFVTHILGSMLPTPGGVGFMELGLTGALVAVGTQSSTALAAVLIYRFVTFLLPILIGTVLYGAWRQRRRRDRISSKTPTRSDTEGVAEGRTVG